MVFINKKDFSIVNVIEDADMRDDYFECDDFIAPAISLLNKKGYKTYACCSGHYPPKSTTCGFNVSFKNLHTFDGTNMPGTFIQVNPNRKTLNSNCNSFIMSYKIADSNNTIIDINKEFYKWVEGLEDISGGN